MKTIVKNLIYLIIVFFTLLGNTAKPQQIINDTLKPGKQSYLINYPDSITRMGMIIKYDTTVVSDSIYYNVNEDCFTAITTMNIDITFGYCQDSLKIYNQGNSTFTINIKINQNSSIQQYNYTNSIETKLIKIVDLLGREVNPEYLQYNQIYIYCYSNGFSEKKMIVK